MKKMKRNKAYSAHPPIRKNVIIIAILGYFAGLLIGLAFTIAVPVLNGKDNLFELAEEQTRSILETYIPSSGPTYGTEFYLFRDDDVIIYSNTEFLHPSEREKLSVYADAAFEKGRLYQMTVLKMGDSGKGRNALCVVCGVTREGHNGRNFAGVLLRDLKDIDISIETFIGIYTLLFVTATLLILYIIREQKGVNQMRRDLVANVSHELKTPITSIKAIAEILHDGMVTDSADIHRYSASILKETDNLEEMVMEILELSRLQSHSLSLKKEIIYADGLFPPLVDRYMMLCTDLNVQFLWQEPDYAVIPPLYTNIENITKVLSILLDNAIKFTGKGGQVSLSLSPGKDSLTVSVRDNGPGIRAEDLERIFERFYKADATRNTTGSGLGLAIAHEITQELGEKLWVESTYGAGSEFFCTIHYK